MAGKTTVAADRLEEKTAGYGLVTLRSGYDTGRLRVDMAIENLFDRDYIPRLATRDAPGRNIKVGIFKTF